MKKSIAIVDCRICEQSVKKLQDAGFLVLRASGFYRLSEGIRSHPDMLMLIEGESLFTHREYFEANRVLFEKIKETKPDLSFYLSDEKMLPEYPSDILFNAYIHGKAIFGKEDSLSLFVRQLCKSGYLLQNVKQGYASCSCCRVGDGVITADKALYRALTAKGIDVLKIDEGHIALPCHDYGFIGGASGYADGVVYFNGDIDTHPNSSDIRNFAERHGCRLVCLCDGMLTDVGKILFI